MTAARDGRVFQPALTALLDERSATPAIVLGAPAVGLWRGGPAPGTLVAPGSPLGELEILGVLYQLEAPADARGIVTRREDAGQARVPVAHGTPLLVLDPEAALGAAGPGAAEAGASTRTAEGGLVFRAPMSGRYYSRPGPDKPPFLQAGDELRVGATVCLLEVMKTFNRVTYGGSGLPEVARVKAVVPGDDDDIAAGDIILYLE